MKKALTKKERMRKKIIEGLIKRWYPGHKLIKIRGPYRQRPEVVHMGRMRETLSDYLLQSVPEFTMERESPVPLERDQSDGSVTGTEGQNGRST